MKVVGSRQRGDRRRDRLVSGQGGARSDGARPPAGAGARDQFANAGEISPGYASPWAAPGIPQKAVRWLMMRHAPLVLRPRSIRRWRYGFSGTLRNCTERRYALNKGRMVRLAEYSRDKLIELRAETGIRYRPAHAGNPATIPHRRAARRHRQGRGGAAAPTAFRSRRSTRTVASRPSRRWRACAA